MLEEALVQLASCAICTCSLSDNIRLVQNIGNICEICFNEKHNKKELLPGSYISNTPLEVFLAALEIPCKFKINGCQELFQGNLKKTHEEICCYRFVPCPYKEFGNCRKEIVFTNIFSHLLTEHSDSFLEFENMSFKIKPFQEANEIISSMCLLSLHNHIFLLRYIINYQNNNCKLNYDLYYIPNDSKNFFEKHNIKFIANNNMSVQLENNTVLIGEFYKTAGLSNEIDVNSVKKLVKASDVITIQFCTNSIPQNIVNVLECPICNELMNSKIYLCNRGHSICNNCKLQINQCPSCKEPYQTKMRNYLAEEILSLYQILIKCQFSNCNYLGSLEQVDAHEENCAQKLYLCPICNEEKHGYYEIKDHFKEKHDDLFTDSEVESFNTLITSGTHYMFAYDKLFQLTTTLSNTNQCTFSLNIIGSNKFRNAFMPIVTISNGDLIAIFKMEYAHQPITELVFSGINGVFHYDRNKIHYNVKIEKVKV